MSVVTGQSMMIGQVKVSSLTLFCYRLDLFVCKAIMPLYQAKHQLHLIKGDLMRVFLPC